MILKSETSNIYNVLKLLIRTDYLNYQLLFFIFVYVALYKYVFCITITQILTEDSKIEGGEFKMTTISQHNREKTKKVGHSKFYDVSPCGGSSEKQDIMKPEDYLEGGKILNKQIYLILKNNLCAYRNKIHKSHIFLYFRNTSGIKYVITCPTRMHYFQWCYLSGSGCNKCTKIRM